MDRRLFWREKRTPILSRGFQHVAIAVVLIPVLFICRVTPSLGTTALNMDREPQVRELLFPQFAAGGGFFSSFFLTNPSPTRSVSGLVRFYDDDGMRAAVSMEGEGDLSEIPFAVAPLGAVVLTTAESPKQVSGSARVIADGPIGGVLRFSSPTLGSAAVSGSEKAFGFIVPAFRSTRGNISTGIAVASAGSSVTLLFTLRGPAGDPIPGGQVSLWLPANGHVARFIHQLFPQLDTNDFKGTVTITSDGGEITGTAIEIGSRPGEMTAVPVSPLQK